MTAASIVKYLFCFKKPRLTQLCYLPVLIKDKPVLFVAWDITHAWSVRFIPLKQTHNAANNAAVVSIPAHLNQVTLEASNYWRKTTINLTLHAVELDEITTAKLIDGFRPLNKTEVNTPLVTHIKNKVVPKNMNIHQRNSAIQHIDRFKITIHPLTAIVQPIPYQ